MRILKLTLGKIFSANFPSVFCFFSIKHPDGLSVHPDGCDSNGRTIRLQVQTRTTCHMLMWQRVSRRGPHRFLKSLAAASQAYPTRFSLEIVSFCALLSWVSAKSRLILSSCAYFSPFHVFFLVLFILFSGLLPIRILTLLGICFENMNCIFVISAVLGLLILFILFDIILNCIVTFTDCNFWKIRFYCRYNAGFCFQTNKNLILLEYFWKILLVIFAETCMLAVHKAESNRG
jgi:hypothetical protein